MAVAMAMAASGMAASCVKLNWSYPEDYIGPSRTAAAVPAVGPPAPAKAAQGPKPTAPGPAQEPAAGQAAKTVTGLPDTGAKPSAGLPPAATGQKPLEPVKIGVTDAILTALSNNQALVVEKLNTPITRTFEDQALAVFDPDLTAGLSRSRAITKGRGGGASTSVANEAQIGVQQLLPTGTQIGVDASTAATHGSGAGEEFFTSRLGLSVTQALLRGYGLDVNLASLRQARLDTLSTQYELRGFAESLVAQVEETYWDYTLAQRQIEIFTESLHLAEQQLNETEERIRIGKLAEIERAASEAEVASRREDLINANAALTTTRLRLLRLLNPGVPSYWSRDVAIETTPAAPELKLEDLESHVQVAERLRPDLNQARLQVQRGDLEIVKTRNGLLPKLDLFMTLGKSGYAETFGRSLEHLDDRGYDLLVGVNVEYPLWNRDAKARNMRAGLTRRQSIEAVTNLAQLVEVDVRSAYVEVHRAKEQVAATAVTRRLQEEKARAEMEKFRVGKSTTLLVAQAQRDLLASRINEVQALVAYLKAIVEFYRLEGSLLMRRGVEAPGQQPIVLTE
jgi:outer membrane protein TolC